jgi:hypothetical protein
MARRATEGRLLSGPVFVLVCRGGCMALEGGGGSSRGATDLRSAQAAATLFEVEQRLAAWPNKRRLDLMCDSECGQGLL